MTTLFRILAALAGLTLLAACSTSQKTAAAESIPQNQLAILESNHSVGADVFMTEVDGQRRSYGHITRVEFAPGERSIKVMGNTQGGKYANRTLIWFKAEPGEVYELKFETDGPSWRAWIVNKRTGVRIDKRQQPA
jgi:hypothetical protein